MRWLAQSEPKHGKYAARRVRARTKDEKRVKERHRPLNIGWSQVAERGLVPVWPETKQGRGSLKRSTFPQRVRRNQLGAPARELDV